jgi:phenylacetate-CoA ligase
MEVAVAGSGRAQSAVAADGANAFRMSDLHEKLIFEQLTQAFAKSQDFPRREIERRQAALLERLVRHAHANVPFYRDSGRLKPLFRADGAFDLAGWSDVLVLTRNEAKANEEALHARVTPPDMGELAAYSTSGSTGTPLKFRQTQVQRVASEVLINRALQWCGAWPMGAFALAPNLAPTHDSPPGMVVISPNLDFQSQVDLLRRHRTTHALSLPSIAEAWAETAGEEGLPDLAAILITGSVLRPDVRARIERRLRVKVVNLYSTSELGPIAAEGPDGRLRVNEEVVWLEGPRSAAEAMAPTRVVVTPFYAFATPLIRYAPGDYVRFSTAAPKRAPGLRRLDEVVGRARGLLRLPDGRPFMAFGIHGNTLATILDHREWQFVQTSLSEMTMNIVVPRPPTAEQLQALEDYLKTVLPHHRTTIAFVEAIDNPMASGKPYEPFLSLIDPVA